MKLSNKASIPVRGSKKAAGYDLSRYLMYHIKLILKLNILYSAEDIIVPAYSN